MQPEASPYIRAAAQLKRVLALLLGRFIVSHARAVERDIHRRNVRVAYASAAAASSVSQSSSSSDSVMNECVIACALVRDVLWVVWLTRTRDTRAQFKYNLVKICLFDLRAKQIASRFSLSISFG